MKPRVSWTADEERIVISAAAELLYTRKLTTTAALQQAQLRLPTHRQKHVLAFYPSQGETAQRLLAAVVKRSSAPVPAPTPTQNPEPQKVSPLTAARMAAPGQFYGLTKALAEGIADELAREIGAALAPRLESIVRQAADTVAKGIADLTPQPSNTPILAPQAAVATPPRAPVAIPAKANGEDHPAVRPPRRVVVVSNQAGPIIAMQREYEDMLDLRFVDVQHLHRIASAANTAAKVVLMAKFVSHKAQLQVPREKRVIVRGGFTQLREALDNIALAE